MKHCTPDDLVAYVDGAIVTRDAARVRAHIAECTDCARTVVEQESVKRLLSASAAGMLAPSGFATRIAAALDNMPPSPPSMIRRIGGWRGPMMLSVAAIVATSGLWFVHTRPQPVDVAALVSVHRHAFQPPAGKTLMTQSDSVARAWLRQSLSTQSNAPALPLPLAGIGACHVGDTPAAIWMYQAEQPITLIEVFGEQQTPGWPSASVDRKAVRGTYGGYNVIVWTGEGRTFALVAKLPPEQLARLLGSSP